MRKLYMICVRPQSAKDLKRTSRTVMKLVNSSPRKPFRTNTYYDEVINLKINMSFMQISGSLLRLCTQCKLMTDFSMQLLDIFRKVIGCLTMACGIRQWI